jgi:hypothetical protein
MAFRSAGHQRCFVQIGGQIGFAVPNRPGDAKFWVNAVTPTCAGILLFDRYRIFRLRRVDPLMIGTFRSQHNTCSVPAWHKDLRLERLGSGYTICSGRAAKTITQTDWAGRTQRFPHTDNPLLKSEFSEKAPDSSPDAKHSFRTSASTSFFRGSRSPQRIVPERLREQRLEYW